MVLIDDIESLSKFKK